MPKKKPRHTEEDREVGLLALATIGNSEEASRQLKRQGYRIPARTLRDWQERYHERYIELRTEAAPYWRERAAATLEDLLPQLTEAQQLYLDRAIETASETKGSEAARAVKDLNIATGVTIDKVNALRGQPTRTIEHRYDVGQLDQALLKLLEEAEAEAPVTDAEVVEDPLPELPT
jgi:hypothetical protein